MDVNQTWMTFAGQYGDDGWEDGDLLHQGKNVKWEAGTNKTTATKQNTNTLGDDLVWGSTAWTPPFLVLLPSLTPPYWFRSFFPAFKLNKVKWAGRRKQRFIDSFKRNVSGSCRSFLGETTVCVGQWGSAWPRSPQHLGLADETFLLLGNISSCFSNPSLSLFMNVSISWV